MRVAMRDCLARAVLHIFQKTASNWRVCILQPDQDALGQAATACLWVSPLNSDCVKSTTKRCCELLEFNLALFLRTRLSGLLEGPTSAPSAPPQYEAAPKLATAKYRRRCTGFLHRRFTDFSNSRIALGDSVTERCEKDGAQGRK